MHDAGIQVQPGWLYLWFRVSGQARQIRAGSYEVDASTTPWQLLNKLIRGDESLRALTLVEGWNWRQVREALAKADALKPESQTLTDDALMARLNRPVWHQKAASTQTPTPIPKAAAICTCCDGP